MRRAVLILVGVSLCATISATLYATSGKSRVNGRPDPVSDGVNIILEAASIDPIANEVNDARDAFAVPIRLTTKNVIEGPVVTEIPAGTAVGKDYLLVYPLEGDPLEYPLDRYRYSYQYTDKGRDMVAAPLMRIEKVVGDSTEPVPIGLLSGPDDILEGWTDDWNLSVVGSTLKTTLDVERSGGLLAWSAFAARRPIEPGLASWLAALLFALIPLRINLPGAPPIGAWIDAIVFFWVEVAVLGAMATFIIAWFRFRDIPDYSDLREARAKRFQTDKATRR